MPTGMRHYHIETVLGRGAFGTVYKARFEGERGFSKQVALKVLNAQVLNLEEVSRRLRDEARMMALLRHRAIVGVDRLASLGGRWAVVMDYVEGVDLGQVVTATQVPLGAALEIVAEVASALDAALHTPGPDGRPLNVVHRDLKPSNLMLTAYGEVKILDFGGARADFGEREAETQNFTVGSLAYMAPERLDFRDSPASDVYSLGAILYELVTGKRFGRTSMVKDRHLDKLGPALEAFACCLPQRDPEPVYMLSAMLDHDEAARPSVRQVEQGCQSMARQLDHERLRPWAEGVVPLLLASPSSETPDEFTGTLMREDSDAQSALLGVLGAADPLDEGTQYVDSAEISAGSTARAADEQSAHTQRVQARPAPVEQPAARAARGSPWLTRLLLVTVMALSATLAWMIARDAHRSPAALVADQAPGVTSEPGAGTEETEATATSPADPVASAAQEAAARAAQAAAAVGRQASLGETTSPVATQPGPDEQPKTLVEASGDASRVRLVSGGASGTLPANLPAGSYSIQADFGDGSLVTVGRVELTGASAVTVHCSARFVRCGAK